MRADAKPYLVPGQQAMRHQSWTYRTDDEWLPLPDELTGWDGNSDIHIRASVVVDLVEVYAQARLPTQTPLALTVSWLSSTSGMVDGSTAHALSSSGSAVLDAVLLGGRVGGTLTITTTLSLVDVPHEPQPGVARHPGSVLLESVQRVVLEPPTSLFPVHDLDFAAVPGLDDQASWHLEVSTDLESPFFGTCRLLINRRDGELLAAVKRERKDSRQEALVDDLTHGVAQLLMELAVRQKELLTERDSWPEGTVGGVLLSYLQHAGGSTRETGTDADSLSRFRTQLAGATRALGYGRPFS